MTIRKAAKEDSDKLFSLILLSQLFQKKELEGKTLDEEQFTRETRKTFDEWLKSTDKIYLIAEEENGIIGFVLLFIDNDISKDASISDLYIIREMRGKGVAQYLVKEAMSILKKMGMQRVSLAVHNKNPSALRVYTSAGFVPKDDDYQLMELDLGTIN